MTTVALSRSVQPDRPWTLVAAAWLSVINAIGSVAPIPFIWDDIPPAAVALSTAFTVIVLAGVWGMWNGSKWLAIVLFVITALNVVISIPGMFAAPTLTIRILTAVGTPLLVAACILIAVKPTREFLR